MPALPALPALPAFDPARLAEIQHDYFHRWQKLFVQAATPQSLEPPADRRFADPAWQDGVNALNASLYLLNADALMKMADAVQGDAQTRERIRFATQQWVEAMSPANFLATNPEAQRKLIETQGRSLGSGIGNLLADLARGRISQTDETAFEVGRNVATSPGSVVFQNELFQLVHYAPKTPKVGSRPLLMVPPCINKFYILDLQPDNSYVANAVENGHAVFMVSWRNVGPDQGHLTWDDYLETGVCEAIRVVREISGQDTLNMLGFCVGGTILCTALAALAARGEHPCESLTLLTTLLDFAEPGVLGVFVDETFVRMREQQLGNGGILAGRDLATTFSFLRPNDLVWNYVVSNYLKGEAPAPFDLLYWNADSTNLPGPMYCWYLRHTYLENKLKDADACTSMGQPIDLGRIDAPSYVFGAREDHIVPWRAAFASTGLLGGDARFVLGASGHIAGTINSAKKNKRSYWVGPAGTSDPEQWLEAAEEKPGSWWRDWTTWLETRKGEAVDPARFVSDKYRPIEPAPGSYVKQKAS